MILHKSPHTGQWGGTGQDQMAQHYVPAGSGFTQDIDFAPHLCCDKTCTVLTRYSAKEEMSVVLCAEKHKFIHAFNLVFC